MIGGPISGAPIASGYGTPEPVAIALSGRATILANGRAGFAGSLSLSAAATLSATVIRVKFGAAALNGTSSLAGQALFRIYAATKEFITRPTDRLANTPFYGTLQKALRFDRSILSGRGIGEITAGWGELELINAEADYDALIDRYAIDGRRVVVRVGADGASYDQFRTLFDGTAADWDVEEDILRVSIRDNSYKLEVPASPSLYAGTGGTEGGEDLKGKRKPRAFGQCGNVSPPAEIPAELIYRVNDGPIHAVSAVYDRAVALAFASDFASIAALRAATTGAFGSGAAIEAGEYATCLADGYIRLGGSPVGTVTCDLMGDKAGGVYVDSTADIVERLLIQTAGLQAGTELSQPSFDGLNADQPNAIGYWMPAGSEETVAAVASRLMTAAGGWGGFRRNGRFEVHQFKYPGGIPSARYNRIDIVEIKRERLPADLSPTPWRWRVGWGRNWTVQTDVDGQSGVTPARVAFLREEVRLAEASSATIRADRPLGKDIEPIEAFFVAESAAQAEASRLLDLYGRSSALYRISMKAQAFIHDIGDVIEVTYSRWDLGAGRLLRIVSISEDTDENTVEIVGFG
ncbi:MAG TPA: hypothetical protein VGO06_13655 [Bosea sp. (in: a-proteobacteria)]|jgi:hypothetical protein|uniref:hypothetical protein n=1 Tax=Bosea sp. (in: a-proteobacteria) TaxID=1871050 RepID=UPI002E107081|nr:hypothetical protein [Bosea sp. (in: a-proteobacteria)]